MKIQELAIIFVIIILPISILLSEYTQFQIQTINMQTEYDAKLTTAAYDAIRAFQLNSSNSTTSNLANSKIRDIEASINAFRNSIMSGFKLNGYTEDELNNYIPALVYTLYDGFYIYSPYENVNYRYETDDDGNITNQPTDDNGKKLYGLKPYISYSCRYKKGNIDVVITYALDNYITVQGNIRGEYVNKSGYLIDAINVDGATGKVTYNNEIQITTEQLKEYLPIKEAESKQIPNAYPYAKINGTKYYMVDLKEDVEGYDSIIYILNGTYLIQCQKSNTPEGGETDQNTKNFEAYKGLIEGNNQAIQYYKGAAEFTNWIRNESGLGNLQYQDAINEDGNIIWEGNDTNIFTDTLNNIENELSNFNQHRLAVIRYTIETNLAIAISNYNSYSGIATSNVFQMPELKEDEWEHITHNISLISFLQGLPIGGKIYNGYSLVTNSESKEVVIENNIYILGNDGNYHKIGDKYLESEGTISSGNYGGTNSAGRLNIDFKRVAITGDTNTQYYYPLKEYNASYNSVIMQNEVTAYDDIYAYVNSQSYDLKKAFYTALGRERASKYNSSVILDTDFLQGEKYEIRYSGTVDGVTDIPASQMKIEGIDTYLSTDSPKREGYIFKRWNTSPDGTGDNYNKGDVYTNDASVTLFAVWKRKEFTVTLDANGGSGGPGYENGLYGDVITIPTQSPEREGYDFLGWSSSPVALTAEYVGGNRYPTTGGLTRNETLYAVWVRKTYTVKYNVNGGNKQLIDQTKIYGENIQLHSTIPTKNGYDFLGWDTNSNATSVRYQPGETYKENSNVTLYAVWSRKTYTVTYDANGGSGAPGSQIKTHGINLTLSSTTPSRTGYNFLGWNTNSSATTATYRAGGTYTTDNNVTLYAIWSRKTYTVTYNANGGSGAPSSQTKTYGIDLRISSKKPTRTGYNFLGWDTNSNATSVKYQSGGTYKENNSATLYAVWQKVSVTSITINQTSAIWIPQTSYGSTNNYTTLTATVSPSNALNKNVTWSSSNTRAVTVNSSGRVTAKEAGKSTITVTSSDNSSVKATINVYVYNAVYTYTKARELYNGREVLQPVTFPVGEDYLVLEATYCGQSGGPEGAGFSYYHIMYSKNNANLSVENGGNYYFKTNYRNGSALCKKYWKVE